VQDALVPVDPPPPSRVPYRPGSLAIPISLHYLFSSPHSFPRPFGSGIRYTFGQKKEQVLVPADTTEVHHPNSAWTKRWLLFSCWILLSSLLFKNPVGALVRLSLSQDDASYLVVIPFISATVFYFERPKIFLYLAGDKILAAIFLLFATCAVLASHLLENHLSPDVQLSGWILSLLLVWVAGFALFFGKTALNAAHFSLLFLLLMIPPPNFLLGRIIYLLQEGSAWITGALFDLVGVPALREGLVFHLARVNIEVAKECSGIRSSMALLILALLISHFRLKSFWNKTLFVACGLFMMILKNGIRIATLTLLAIYVDPNFLFGRLHHQGGVVFFVLALLLLLPLLFFLQRAEAKTRKTTEPS
jgi:exosortase